MRLSAIAAATAVLVIGLTAMTTPTVVAAPAACQPTAPAGGDPSGLGPQGGPIPGLAGKVAPNAPEIGSQGGAIPGLTAHPAPADGSGLGPQGGALRLCGR